MKEGKPQPMKEGSLCRLGPPLSKLQPTKHCYNNKYYLSMQQDLTSTINRGFKQILAMNSKSCVGFLKKKKEVTILNKDVTSQSVSH